ncbi:hypothetical protein ACFCYH_35195 [Streptomyces sp. NPDC056400]|uniref:hypothetical protein n=1 Tax=Streptomyces sp. NPDC056400 TaxID=3345808 RepID=UPI0035E245A9
MPNISYVRNFADLHAALLDLYRKDGSRPYQELEKGSRWLPHSTVSRVIARTTRPSREFVLAFATECGVRGQALKEWEQAFDRVEESRKDAYTFVRHGNIHRAVPLTRWDPPRARAAAHRASTNLGEIKVYFDPQRLSDGTEVRRATTVDVSGGQVRYAIALDPTAPAPDGGRRPRGATWDLNTREVTSGPSYEELRQTALSARELEAARSLTPTRRRRRSRQEMPATLF